LGRIVAKLQQQGIPSPAGKPKWNSQAIDKMLNNEKYTGNVVLGKTVTQDGIQIKNRDTSSLTEMQDTHPAIISQEIFEAVQEEKARRIPGVAKYNSSNILSGLLVCGECGSPYRRLTRRHGEIVWRCANRVEHGNRVCRSSSTIPESKVFEHIAATLGCSNEQVVRGMIDKIMVKADSTLHITFRQKARNPFAARER
jgi:site-specific DNA recombinase